MSYDKISPIMTYDYLPEGIGIYLNRKPEYDIQELINLQSNNYVICIDGLAGSGKSTLGQSISKMLKIPHISSGIFYRVFTYIFVVHNIPFTPENIDKITKEITFQINLVEFSILYKSQKIPMLELKNDVIDAALNRFSTDIYFRDSISKILVKMVQSLKHSFILDLRGANPEYVKAIESQQRPVVRLLLVADTETKAKRRLNEYMSNKYSKDTFYQDPSHQDELYKQIYSKIISRDNADIESITKTNIGLIHPKSGIIDTSNITQNQVLDIALNYIQNLLKP
jgi:cytidylate kinase